MSTSEIFAKLRSKLDANPELAAGLTGIVQFEVRGTDPGKYFVELTEKPSVGEGVHPAPTLVLSLNSRDLVELAHGHLNPSVAAIRGRLRMRGDMKLASAIKRILSEQEQSR